MYVPLIHDDLIHTGGVGGDNHWAENVLLLLKPFCVCCCFFL